MQKITPFLWFDNNADEAVKFYVSNFKNSSSGSISRYSEEAAKASGMPKDSVMTIPYNLYGQDFTAINGGPIFKLSPSITFMVNCTSEEEINDLCKKFSVGGKVLMELDKYPFSERFGWLNDKFGVSWQFNMGTHSQKITPLLWFGEQAENAIKFYSSIFKDSKLDYIEHFKEGERGKPGSVKHATFSLSGQQFMAMDNNIEKFNEAISLMVNCNTQEEVDYFWEKLTDGGQEVQCGWLKDKYGVSWQIVPTELGELISSKDPEKSRRVMSAVLQMKKLDINKLREAGEGK